MAILNNDQILTRIRIAETELQQHETACDLCRYQSTREHCEVRGYLVEIADRARRQK